MHLELERRFAEATHVLSVRRLARFAGGGRSGAGRRAWLRLLSIKPSVQSAVINQTQVCLHHGRLLSKRVLDTTASSRYLAWLLLLLLRIPLLLPRCCRRAGLLLPLLVGPLPALRRRL